MKITLVGVGYVGLTTAAALASWGHQVACVNHDHKKISQLKAGQVTLFEPGLPQLVSENVKANRLSFHYQLAIALQDAELVFLAVQTPTDESGQADLSFLLQAAAEVAATITRPAIIVNKSTAPPGTSRHIQEILDQSHHPCPVVVNPEFLREGSALEDIMHPDRVVVGGRDVQAVNTVAGLYEHLDTTIVKTDPESAELIKYASNAFLATKISFINALARLCDQIGADVGEVSLGMGLDQRIGVAFLRAGLGYGGSCFPKDLSGLIQWAEDVGYSFDLLKAVQEINVSQANYILAAIKEMVGTNLKGKHLALLGLAFKPNTDDIRESAALRLAQLLAAEGAKLTGYDPQAMVHVAAAAPYIKLCPDVKTACAAAEAILLLTEWPEFAHFDLTELSDLVKEKILIDTRNLYDPKMVRANGWRYWSVGRP